MTRVMLVDDEPDIRRTVARFLELKGYSVDAFDSAEAALEAFLAQPERYAAILSDVRMPGMGGVALAQKLRAEGNLIPFVFMAGAPEDSLSSEPDLQPLTVLSKPFRFQVLQDAIEAFVTR